MSLPEKTSQRSTGSRFVRAERGYKSQSFTGSYFLYAGTIFLSAFLLFVIQPIAGKHLLPYFGGSSSVWATSLLFFTAVLFLGYLYVYVLTSFGGGRQGLIHACVVGVTVLITIAVLSIFHSLFPSFDWTVGSTQAPSFNVLMALLLAIGAPYFLLSTTGPLLQFWWGMTAQTEVYKLYALSNAGSLLALLSYPFAIEPHISLLRGEGIWAVLFFVFAFVSGIISVIYFRHRPIEVAKVGASPDAPFHVRLLWVVLAALPSYMLVATTTVLTQVVAPVPLLWVIPLTLYLVTFIIAFRGWGQSIFVPPLFLGAVFLAYIYTPAEHIDTVWRICSYMAVLFLSGLLFHARLYRLRPALRELPLFYLLLSFGGMVGALTASLLAPAIFSNFWEFPFGLALSAAFGGWMLSEAFFPRILNRDKIFLTRIVFLCVVIVLFTNLVNHDEGTPTVASRNFYGPAQVRFHDEMTSLLSGGTLHGIQPTAREWRYVPTSYYVSGSGVGRAMLYEQDTRKDEGVRVGVLGLGTGSIASHCRAGDTFVFYEIDPRMEMLARAYFSYLSYCKGSEVRTGDGRLLLEAELRAGTSGEYDLLVMDAFSDDTVPVHLVTREAVALYATHLRGEESIIAIHVSNRYLDLSPVILRIAAELGFNAMVVRDSGESSPFGSRSKWVLLSKSAKVFEVLVFANSDSWLPDIHNAPVWTDDYTSLFSVVALPVPWK